MHKIYGTCREKDVSPSRRVYNWSFFYEVYNWIKKIIFHKIMQDSLKDRNTASFLRNRA